MMNTQGTKDQLTKVSGFFSYAHDDDMCNRLSMLREDLVAEYRQITGDELELFIDREGIEWGDRWARNIEASIDSSMFFIPVLSPLYFRSFYCQQELEQFLRKVEKENARELLLPIYYVDTAYAELGASDGAMKRVFEFQYEDWREMRFAERCSEKYRAAVGQLALRLAKANRSLEQRAAEAVSADPTDESLGEDVDAGVTASGERTSETPSAPEDGRLREEGEPDGFLMDSTQSAIDLADEFSPHMNNATDKMKKIGEVVKRYTDDMRQAASRGPREATAVFARLAADLDPISDDYLAEAKACAEIMARLDPEIRSATAAWERLRSASGRDNVAAENGWRESISGMVSAAEGARPSLRSFNSQVGVLKGVSRVLYGPLRKIERANILFDGVLETASGWLR